MHVFTFDLQGPVTWEPYILQSFSKDSQFYIYHFESLKFHGSSLILKGPTREVDFILMGVTVSKNVKSVFMDIFKVVNKY